MTFINSVAAIVHASTSAWDGECSKNLGSSFLLVWRIGNADEVRSDTATFVGHSFIARILIDASLQVSREVSGDGGGLSPRAPILQCTKISIWLTKLNLIDLYVCAYSYSLIDAATELQLTLYISG